MSFACFTVSSNLKFNYRYRMEINENTQISFRFLNMKELNNKDNILIISHIQFINFKIDTKIS